MATWRRTLTVRRYLVLCCCFLPIAALLTCKLRRQLSFSQVALATSTVPARVVAKEISGLKLSNSTSLGKLDAAVLHAASTAGYSKEKVWKSREYLDNRTLPASFASFSRLKRFLVDASPNELPAADRPLVGKDAHLPSDVVSAMTANQYKPIRGPPAQRSTEVPSQLHRGYRAVPRDYKPTVQQNSAPTKTTHNSSSGSVPFFPSHFLRVLRPDNRPTRPDASLTPPSSLLQTVATGGAAPRRRRVVMPVLDSSALGNEQVEAALGLFSGSWPVSEDEAAEQTAFQTVDGGEDLELLQSAVPGLFVVGPNPTYNPFAALGAASPSAPDATVYRGPDTPRVIRSPKLRNRQSGTDHMPNSTGNIQPNQQPQPRQHPQQDIPTDRLPHQQAPDQQTPGVQPGTTHRQPAASIPALGTRYESNLYPTPLESIFSTDSLQWELGPAYTGDGQRTSTLSAASPAGSPAGDKNQIVPESGVGDDQTEGSISSEAGAHAPISRTYTPDDFSALSFFSASEPLENQVEPYEYGVAVADAFVTVDDLDNQTYPEENTQPLETQTNLLQGHLQTDQPGPSTPGTGPENTLIEPTNKSQAHLHSGPSALLNQQNQQPQRREPSLPVEQRDVPDKGILNRQEEAMLMGLLGQLLGKMLQDPSASSEILSMFSGEYGQRNYLRNPSNSSLPFQLAPSGSSAGAFPVSGGPAEPNISSRLPQANSQFKKDPIFPVAEGRTRGSSRVASGRPPPPIHPVNPLASNVAAPLSPGELLPLASVPPADGSPLDLFARPLPPSPALRRVPINQPLLAVSP
eukprot:GHVT01039401.1.p1 GENE.GHVT01039401.1~~GHVT01039401.1.p1  ORF type:complete len:802 (+),score=90.41 GHVT01039401.1:1081-3486(+)